MTVWPPNQVQNYNGIHNNSTGLQVYKLYMNTECHVTWRRKSVRTRALSLSPPFSLFLSPHTHTHTRAHTHTVLLSTQVLHVSCNNAQTSCKEFTLKKKPYSFKHIGVYFVQSSLVTTCLVYTYRHVLHANR